jgi:hypothetical protein
MHKLGIPGTGIFSPPLKRLHIYKKKLPYNPAVKSAVELSDIDPCHKTV